MKGELLVKLGQIAGVGGISLGVIALVFREVLRKNIFPKMPKAHAYKIIRLIVILTFTIAALGISAWAYVETYHSAGSEPKFPKTSAELVIGPYLALVDANKLQDAWNTMSNLAHDRLDFQTFKDAYETQRSPLGAVVSRKISSTSPVKQLQDGTRGAFTMTTYVTRYQNAPVPYLESVVAVAEEGAWKVLAHVTVPCPQGACPDLATSIPEKPQ